jgi:RND family efflux transporter MFP subunit
MIDPASKTMDIKIKITNYGDTEIPPGVFARANITTRKKTDTLLVPSSALVRKRDGEYVFVIEENVAKQRMVVTGIGQENQVEILQGLEQGDQIVISGNLTLQDGDTIRIIDKGVRQ